MLKLCAFLSILGVAAVTASAQPPVLKPIRTADIYVRGLKPTDFPRMTKLAPNVYVYEAFQVMPNIEHVFITNCFVVVTNDGVLIADALETEEDVRALIAAVAKVTPQLFRAPGGAWSPFIFKAVAAYDLIPLDWDVDPVDWSLPGTRKIERAMLRGRPNDIVLCHDGGGNRTETVRALRHVLPEWKHRGYITIPLIVPANDLNNPPPSSPPPTQSPIVSPSTDPSGTTGATPSP